MNGLEPHGSPGMRHAAIRAIVAAAVGILFSRVAVAPWWAGPAAIALGLLLALPTRWWSLLLVLAGATFLHASAYRPCAPDPEIYHLSGFLATVSEDQSEHLLRRAAVELNSPRSGRVIVWIDGQTQRLRSGDRLFVRGRIRPFDHPRNPGSPDYTGQFTSQGYIGEASVKTGAVQAIGRAHGIFALRRLLGSLRRYVTNSAFSLLPSEEAALLIGMMMGERSALPERTRAAFSDSGTAHVLAVSGLHVGIVAGLLWLLCGLLRIRGWWRFVLMSAAVVAYVILTGARAPAVRAGTMAVAVLLSYPTQRRVEPLALLGAAGLLILLADPRSLFSAGFQLSFAAATCIILITPRLRPFANRVRSRLVRNVLLWPLLVSLSAFVGTGPLLLVHFHRLQILSALFSPLVVALTGIAVPLGFLCVALASVWRAAAALPAETLRLVLWLMLRTTDILAQQHWAMFQPGPVTMLLPAWVYGLVLLALNRRRAWAAVAFRLTLAAGLCLAVWIPALRPVPSRATFLDPGQGDAVLLEDSLGRRVLIDAGVSGREVLRDYLRYRGIRHIDLAIITHPDNDHYGGLLDLDPETRIARLIVPTMAGEPEYAGLLERLTARGTELTLAGTGTEITGLGFGLEFLWPAPQTEALYRKGLVSTNTVSLVTLCTHAGFRMLFTGDLDEPDLLRLVAVPADLLKSPHHGSRKGNELGLYDIVQPDYIVVMGRYPTPAGLEQRLDGRPARYVNTRRDGAWELQFTRRGPLSRPLVPILPRAF